MPQTCSSCHFAGNPDIATTCTVCGVALAGHTSAGLSSSTSPSSLGVPVSVTSLTLPVSPAASSTPLTPPAPTAVTPPPTTPQLEGMLTWFNQTTEQADFNWYKFLSQSILCLTLLPLLLGMFAACSVLWAACLIAGFHGMAKSVSPFGIISGINSLGTLVAVVFPRFSNCDHEPTVRLTIQTPAGERAALIKGELVSGTFRRGDDLEFFGEWRNGTLVVQRGLNRSLATAIELRRDHWRVIFFLIISCLILCSFFILSKAASI